MPDLDLSQPRVLHVVGVGGAGMSAIAAVLTRMGHQVSGSDLKESPALARLRLLGVDARVGHHAANVPADVDAIVCSSAIPATNPEVAAATGGGVPVLRRAEALRALVATRRSVAVAGSHGKTTTSSMLALCLRAAGWHPSFLIGGDLNEVGSNAAYDDGDWLVVEADESDGTFLELAPEAAIVTNVAPDHLDHYGTFDALIDAFATFLDAVPGPRIVGADDPVAARLAAARPGVRTFGWNSDDYRIDDYTGGRAGSRFRLRRGDATVGVLELPIPGRHNALNAAGAAALALELGVDFDAIARALRGFGGVARRFQFRGHIDGVTLIDDYAHNPGKVAAVLQAAREGGWRHVVAVFQPHRYSRTASLWRDYADAFVDADQVVLTDVYGAGEAPQPGVSGRLVLRAILDAHPATPVTYLPRRADVVEHALHLARPGDALVTLGAGDLTTVPGRMARGPRGAPVSLDVLAADLAARLGPAALRRDVPVAELTTYRLGGPIALVVRVTTDADLGEVAAAVAQATPPPPMLVLGRGSNLLVADRGFPGLGVVLAGAFETVDVDRDDGTVAAGAAAPLPVLARQAAAAGLTGLEFYVGIPGSVGGAVRMNAGGHGHETAEVLRRAYTVDLAAGEATPVPGQSPTSTSPTATRRSPPPRWSPAPTSSPPATSPTRARPASTRSCGGGVSTSPAAPTPGRCSATRPATPPAGSSTPPA